MQAVNSALFGKMLLRRQLVRWKLAADRVRREDSPAALHALRVSARHLIAALHWLAETPVDDAGALARRLRALLARTSAARDLDIRVALLTTGDDDARRRALQPVLQTLQHARIRRQLALHRTLDAAATRHLFSLLQRLATQPADAAAARSCAEVARTLVRRRHRRLRKAARGALRRRDAAHCHRLRLETKKLRYILEALGAAHGRASRRYLRRLRRLQALLGRINDAHQSLAWLQAHTPHPGAGPGAQCAAVLAAIAARQAHQLQRCLGALPGAWRHASGRRWRRLRRALDAGKAFAA